MPFAVRIEPGTDVKLAEISPDDDGGLEKIDGERLADDLGDVLTELQEELFAAGMTGLLIVLQGRDTAGKDGTIRHLLKYMNAQSTYVAAFKVPTPKELAHDYLWRVHAATPGRGETAIFNRSHYEDVLVVRVHDLVPKHVWSKRYDHINEFERLLSDAGTVIVKLFLHITKEEQEQRLLDREKEVEKAWKLNPNDWKERAYWDAYTEAYEVALSKCSTEDAPWYVIPSNRKWFRNLAVTEVLVETLRQHKNDWRDRLAEMSRLAKADLEAYRQEKGAASG
ncbi:MAG: Polyphosphate:AMP/ADP phosphotransferase [Fimbriimonadaceae bacterium]|nr:Polyphosphate:AMP/ADP phosphotransferase [Fimbriimonadaceae bacterium]